MGLSVPFDGVSADAVIFCESVSALDKLDLNLFIIDSRILKFMKSQSLKLDSSVSSLWTQILKQLELGGETQELWSLTQSLGSSLKENLGMTKSH